MIGNIDPEALRKDPGAVLKEEAGKKLGELVGGKTGGTQPASQPNDPAKKAVEEGLKGLLGGKKKSDK
jgi:hypothetical protein